MRPGVPKIRNANGVYPRWMRWASWRVGCTRNTRGCLFGVWEIMSFAQGHYLERSDEDRVNLRK